MHDKIGMHVRLTAALDEAIRDRAWELRMSPQELIRKTMAASLTGDRKVDA